MKILHDDKITAVSVSSGAQFSSSFSVSNVQNDIPQNVFMANSASATISATISAGVQAVFVSGLMADNAVIEITDSDNSLTYSEVLNTTKFSSLKILGIVGRLFLIFSLISVIFSLSFRLSGSSAIQKFEF